MANPSSVARNDFFKQLKPRCVSINNLAVRERDKKASAKDLIKVTDDLSALLDRQVAQDASVLDEKLADYIFFPLSNILRAQQEYPIRLTEVTIKCLRVLIEYGWKSKIPKELAQQLLILLTFIIGGVPGQERKDRIPEETELEAFKALIALTKASGSSLAGAAGLMETNAIPALGHAITVVLEGVTDGRTPDLQLEALNALNAIYTAVKDQTALATFLPGIVSSLSRLLTPPTALKTQKRILIRGLTALKDVLTRVLGDIKTMAILNKPPGDKTEKATEGKVLTPSWLKATVAKVKLALASVLKLRCHTSEDVQCALERLCITLLDECHRSLSECASILVETAMILASDEDEKSSLETSLTDLARIYPELGDTIKNTIFNWVTSLPRIVQSSDEKVKQQAIRNLVKGQHFITTLQIDSSILGDSMAASLRDSTTALVMATKPGGGVMSEMPSNAIELKNMDMAARDQGNSFRPVLIAQETERSTRSALLDFISKYGPTTQQVKLASDMLNYVRESSGPSQIASYWLAFELVKATWSQSSDLDDFLDLSSAADASDGSESVFQELYSFSVAILDSQAEAEEVDWRMQALALEVTTFAAVRMQESFRPELIDVLYPIATFLGSDVPQVREHAIISLNSISASCGYSNVTDLIIDNVDYMVNSVSLRLNTFDISPASTQVLRMMIRLTGPKLIPYLDDVVASIFAALDNYHGYTLFVENLFGVLNEVVQQGTKSENLLVEDAKSSKVDHRKTMSKLATTEDLSEILDNRAERQKKRRQEDLEREAEVEKHPQRPWKVPRTTEVLEEGGDDEPSTEAEKPPPPKTPTFKLLSRITDLTQHYLTSPTPTLRKSLLDLLATVCPALSPDEDAFLPLVNSIWPVLVERLYDPKTFVVVAACEALSALCESAGDFLNTRIKDEWSDNLGKWCRRTKAEATAARSRGKGTGRAPIGIGGEGKGLLIPIRSRDGGLEGMEFSSRATVEGAPTSAGAGGNGSTSTGLGRFTQAAQAWEAVQGLLIALVSHVQVDDDVFDQILLLLADSLASNAEARGALEAVDPDAVWLAMYERGMLGPTEVAGRRPVMEGVRFVEV
ncbi:Uu.00g003640.m01.CDS01 [Anthostomella pinea]|uniref:Uu.00g003640.m01.CDS01 n=1 Tax=Anthostomella pinea TaxID=933095 RepID=A0AAI8VJQ2_9PEZI|nr:Uu.00g003640.m01.CDS01 [Anthostomella pinea]